MNLLSLCIHSLKPGTTALLAVVVLTAVLLSAGCTPSTSPSPEPVPLLTHTPSPSPTFVIPSAAPTSTLTPSPSLTPTADFLADVGSLLFADHFENSMGWTLTRDQAGAASITDGRLNLVVSQPSSTRTASAPFSAPNNFLLSVVVRPEICREGDVFGPVVRFSSELEHLRFLLDCSGTVSVESVEQGNRLKLVPDTSTFAALPGAGVSNTLSVRSQENIYTFFLNGIEVLQIKETRLNGTGVGVFTRTDTSELTTVYFDDFMLYDLSPEPLD